MNRRDYMLTLAGLVLGSGAVDPTILMATALNPRYFRKELPPVKLRILSYNIQIGREPGGSYSDPAQAHLDHTAAAINRETPDVAGLQEVDNKTERSGVDVDQLGELSRMTNLFPTFTAKRDLPGGKYGIGVLSKDKPLAVDSVIMEGSAHPRALQMLDFGRFYFFNTHLPLTAELRLKAVNKIEEQALLRNDKPIILVGDLNAEPNSEEIRELKKTWTQISPDAPTFPAPAPTAQIDYVFIRNAAEVKVNEARVVDDPKTSDHRPVFVEVEFK